VEALLPPVPEPEALVPAVPVREPVVPEAEAVLPLPDPVVPEPEFMVLEPVQAVDPPVVPETFELVRIWLVAVSQHWVEEAPALDVPEPDVCPTAALAPLKTIATINENEETLMCSSFVVGVGILPTETNASLLRPFLCRPANMHAAPPDCGSAMLAEAQQPCLP
jgi:hypothetical protein